MLARPPPRYARRRGRRRVRRRARWPPRPRGDTSPNCVTVSFMIARAMTVDEQLAYLTRGCVDVVRRGGAPAKLERSREDRPAARRQGRLRSDRARSAPRAHRAHPEDEALPGSRPHASSTSSASFTALIGDPTGRSKTRPPLTPEEIDAQRRDLQDADLQDPRSAEDRGRASTASGSSRSAAPAGSSSRRSTTSRRCSSGATSGQRYEAGKPIAIHEFLYPLAQAYDSVVLQGRRRARRHRPAVQPERRARHHAGLRSRAADRDDDAAARGARRRREDVEEPRQLRRRHRSRRPRCSAS